MIIETVAGPEMIHTILLSHLLFIKSLSAIIAWAEMKGEGRRERLARRRRCYEKKDEEGARGWKGRGDGRGRSGGVLISVAVIYILIKFVFGSWPGKGHTMADCGAI